MKQKNLLASVALFGQLYNSDKYSDISSLLSDFIKGAIVINNKYSLTSYDIKTLMESTFGFQIPESVIRTVIFSRLKDIAEHEKGTFTFNDKISSEYQDLDKELEEKDVINNHIFSNLKKFVSEKETKELSKENEKELFENFNQFLFDNGSFDKYTNHISSYIISNETDLDFVRNLNSIREGLILYQGIKYTADINELGKWNDNLVIYLNTEYLFNALGYDGVLLKEIFLDFHKLVEEINTANGETKIKLRYFSETKEEIESHFITAESILKRLKRLKPWKTAMKTLVESCKFPSDIITRKVEFYSELERLGIELQEFNYSVEEYSSYNVEDKNIIAELKRTSKKNKKFFDEESCSNFFRMFTKVNFFRKGNSRKSFEKIGHIFITNSGFAKYLGHNNNVKFQDSDISFAKDIDFITTRFWIKLKKGFSEKTSFPKSFNVLTKAKIIISSQINSSMSKEFDKLVKDTKEGKLTKEEALKRSYALREKPSLPLEINSSNIDSTFDFLNDESYLENIIREEKRKNDLIEETQLRNAALEKELERRDEIDKKREEREKQKIEAQKLKEKTERYERDVETYNQNMSIFCELKWASLFKEKKWHFWRYLIFILSAIVLIFILVGLRDKILELVNIQITERAKLVYSGLVMIVGFLATAVRSFFDTKNILVGLKIIFDQKFKKEYKET
ncbi:MAG: hypothetical protein JEY97_12430, partial [Bacteroidales bacterium]|nr:hypothetical protein [Bacteroidales bacterium]